MRKRRGFGEWAAAFCCGMLLSSSTWAASIVPVQGDLSINQGQGFQPINSRVDASVGDSVMVGPGGAATVVYGDGCKVDVQPGAVATIAPLSPCASGSYAADDSNWGAYVAGAGVVGVGVFVGIELSKRSTPTSP